MPDHVRKEIEASGNLESYMKQYSSRRFSEMIFKFESMFKEMAERLVAKYNQDEAWEQWFDVERLENYYWTEGLIDENLSGKYCMRLRGMNADSELFALASHAMAYKLTGGDEVVTKFQIQFEESVE